MDEVEARAQGGRVDEKIRRVVAAPAPEIADQVVPVAVLEIVVRLVDELADRAEGLDLALAGRLARLAAEAMASMQTNTRQYIRVFPEQ
jgi:hypothetical protein